MSHGFIGASSGGDKGPARSTGRGRADDDMQRILIARVYKEIDWEESIKLFLNA